LFENFSLQRTHLRAHHFFHRTKMAVELVKMFLINKMGSYNAISSMEKHDPTDEEDEISSHDPLRKPHTSASDKVLTILPWITTLLLAIGCLTLMRVDPRCSVKFVEETKGYSTDFGDNSMFRRVLAHLLTPSQSQQDPI
jgi:hypothetical protein